MVCVRSRSFGVVVAFATNSYLHQGVENATFTAREGVQDTQKFLRTTSAEANHLLQQNYGELNGHLIDMLQGWLVGCTSLRVFSTEKLSAKCHFDKWPLHKS